MSDMMFRIHHQDPRTLFQALLESSAIHGAGKAAVEDIERQPLSYGRLVTGALVLGGRIAKDTQRGEIVGLLLPTAAGAAVSFRSEERRVGKECVRTCRSRWSPYH